VWSLLTGGIPPFAGYHIGDYCALWSTEYEYKNGIHGLSSFRSGSMAWLMIYGCLRAFIGDADVGNLGKVASKPA